MYLAAVVLALLMGGSPRPADATPRPNQVVALSAVRLEPPLAAARPSTLSVTADVLPGWHINSDRPADPDYIPTRLAVKALAGISVGPVQYPPAQELTPSFARGEKLAVFSGRVQFKAVLMPRVSPKPRLSMPATLTLEYQACNDNQCLSPTAISTTVDLTAPGAGFQALGSGEGTAATGEASGASAALAGVFRHRGYVLGFLLVLLGGLALNLTPCVYPLVGVTIAYFGRQGGGTRRTAALAGLYVVGIALTFSAVGVAVALSGGLFGAAMESPPVLLAVAAMLVVLAASSFGWFSLRPPQWMLQATGTARPGYLGAIVMGLGMGVVAAPCIGPFVLGLLFLVERSRSLLFGFTLFFTLALGMGLPYIALALAAGSIRKLPRSGEWLAWMDQLFGFVLLGLALYFIDPLVPNHLVSRLLPFYAAGSGIALGFVSPVGRAWRPFQLFKLAVGAVSLVGLAYLLTPRAPTAHLAFKPFDGTLLARAEAGREPVLIDFSADWCIPCREMDYTTFTDPAVINEASRFLMLRADLTRQNGDTQALVSRFEVEGVPTMVFIDSQGRVRKRLVGYASAAEFLKSLRQID